MGEIRSGGLPAGFGGILKLVLAVIVIIVILCTLLGASYTVPTGARGVLLQFSKASAGAIEPGLHFKMPWRDHVVIIPITIQRATAQADALSNDLQVVRSTCVLNYHIGPNQVVQVYSTIGSTPDTVEKTIIDPAVQEVLKAVAAQYNAASLISQRPKVAEQMRTFLKQRIESRGLVIDEFSITDFSFSAKFAGAIEAKTAAEQDVLTAQQTLAKVKIDAEQKVAQASADAQATMLRAKAEAEALRLQREQVSPELVQLRTVEVMSKFAEKWDGVAPSTLSMGGGGGLSMLVPAKEREAAVK